VRPSHAGASFSGGSIRDLATDLIQSRLDPLIDASARVHELALEGVPGWDRALGAVRPHVHAKVVVADGAVAAVASANLDITASDWESEALVVLEDARVVKSLESEIDYLSIPTRGRERARAS
jgi:phosphatidylserine/phosphatidylglycerophosphate/cardiolipin synthase-like enzyme